MWARSQTSGDISGECCAVSASSSNGREQVEGAGARVGEVVEHRRGHADALIRPGPGRPRAVARARRAPATRRGGRRRGTGAGGRSRRRTPRSGRSAWRRTRTARARGRRRRPPRSASAPSTGWWTPCHAASSQSPRAPATTGASRARVRGVGERGHGDRGGDVPPGLGERVEHPQLEPAARADRREQRGEVVGDVVLGGVPERVAVVDPGPERERLGRAPCSRRRRG